MRRMLEIRPIRAAEVAAAHALEVASYAAAEAASLERMRDRRARFPEGFLGVFEGGALSAFICCVRSSVADLADESPKREGGHDPAGRDLLILSVTTAAAERRRGIAGVMLGAIVLVAQRLGIRRLRLLCKAHLVPLYARHGYRDLGPATSTYGGARWHEMERAP
jgi:GNAT superfamily N-acetyltransferase